MNPGHIRLRTSKADGIIRFRRWMGRALLEPARECSSIDAIRLATPDMKLWKGTAVLVGEAAGWTVFSDLSGGLDCSDADELLALAGPDELVLMAYNDARCSARLVAIKDRQVLKDFSEDSDLPEFCWNRGTLDDERTEPIKDWVDVASRMDDRELEFDVHWGTLLLFVDPPTSG